MKNKEPSKISLTFLGFFYHFLQLFKVLLKKKKKEKLEQCWADSSPGGPSSGENAPAPTRWLFCEKGLSLLINLKWVQLLLH
jgi:hypothetical protein